MIVVFKCVTPNHLVSHYFHIKNELEDALSCLFIITGGFLLASLGHIYIYACVMVVHVVVLKSICSGLTYTTCCLYYTFSCTRGR